MQSNFKFVIHLIILPTFTKSSKDYYIEEIKLANSLLKSSHRRFVRDNQGLFEEINDQASYERECREQPCDDDEFQEATKSLENKSQLEQRIRNPCSLGQCTDLCYCTDTRDTKTEKECNLRINDRDNWMSRCFSRGTTNCRSESLPPYSQKRTNCKKIQSFF